MKTIIKLVVKDIIRFFNDVPAVLLSFLVPIVLIVIFASIFGGHGSQRGKLSIFFVNNSGAEQAKLIEAELDSSEAVRPVKGFHSGETGKYEAMTENKAKELVRQGDYAAALVLPENFYTDTSSALRIRFYYDPRNEIEHAMIQGEMQKIIMGNSAKLLPALMQSRVKSELGDEGTASFENNMSRVIKEHFGIDEEVDFSIFNQGFGALGEGRNDSEATGNDGFFNTLIKFESEQLVGEEISNPGVTRIVGGWAMMFLLFSLTGAATSLFEEKQEGSLKRMLTMPVKRSHILWSKYIFSILLGVAQLFVMFLFAWLFYNVDIFSNFFNLCVVILASAGAAVAFGMIITSFATSLGQANGIATLIILAMSALGGSWFPIAFFPDWLRAIAKFTLTYWSVDAFLQVLWRQASLFAILPNLAVLLSIAIIVNYYSLIRFKKGKMLNE